ncbi:MAG: hypothetical protein HYR73_00465 [Candidatus Eisenbacteria bacterium]|nr:hypothetical protein [Candidatus Eisenbacteria bacterium]
MDQVIRRLLGALLRLAVLLLLAAFLVYVWPTRFKYDHLSTDGNTYPVRIDRFSGESDMLVPDEGWVPVEGDSGDGNPDANHNAGVRS